VSDVDFLKRLNQRILADLSAREAEVAEREEQANRALKECVVEREAIGVQRMALEQVEALQISALEFGPPSVGLGTPEQPVATTPRTLIHRPDDSIERKPKARVGDQRYIMLTSVREVGFLTMDDIVERTGYSLKRVKDQIRADCPEFLRERYLEDGKGSYLTVYELTKDGEDLLKRFEDYRRSKNIPLPELGDTASEHDEDLPLESTPDGSDPKPDEAYSMPADESREESSTQSVGHGLNNDPIFN